MGIYNSETPKVIKVYRDGEMVERVELLTFNADEYTNECGFLGVFSSFCSVNGSTSYYERILTLDQIKEYQQKELDFDPLPGIIIEESSMNTKKRIRTCNLI